MQVLVRNAHFGAGSDLLNQLSVSTSFQVALMRARVGKPSGYKPSGDPCSRKVGFPEELSVRWCRLEFGL